MNLKCCSKCKQFKSLDCFSKCKKNKDGLRCRCRECSSIDNKKYFTENYDEIKKRGKIWRDAHRTELRARNKKYCEENHDKVIAYSRKFYQEHAKEENARVVKFRQEHREQSREYDRKYYKKCKEEGREYQQLHKEKAAQTKRNYYLRHKQECLERSKNWEKSHPEEYRCWHRNHEVRKINAPGNGITPEDWEYLLERDKKCLWCGTTHKLSLDHVIPLTKGGAHDISNAQVLCRSCNSKKNDRIMDFRVIQMEN